LDQPTYAFFAAATAASTTPTSLSGAEAIVSPVAGLTTSSVAPAADVVPPLKFSIVVVVALIRSFR
jgi:hypothetical protein